MLTPLEIAKDYIGRGWAPIPIPHMTKAPTIGEWQHLRISLDDARRFFNGKPQNIGVLMGEASQGLTDVDLDCEEAVSVASWLLPKTDAIFGRQSRRGSHWLYRTELSGEIASKALEFRDPMLKPQDHNMLVELRIGGGGLGAQTVFPGSTHETGEPIEWESNKEPTEVNGRDLREQVACVAAAALLARYWAKSGRHAAAFALGGLLSRLAWKPPFIKLFVEAVARAAGDEEVRDRVRAAEDAAGLHAQGKNTFGFPKLKELFGEPIAKKVCEWLGYQPTSAHDREQAQQGHPERQAPREHGKNEALTEDAAALQFAELYEGKLRFCWDTGAWFEWNGSLWRQNRTGIAFAWARNLVREMAQEQPEKVRNVVSKAAFAGNVERYARSDPALAVTIEHWDRDPFLLGTPAGTVDLRTGGLRPSDPAEGITKSTAVAPGERADCPRWHQFLQETTGEDAELIRFIQQWFGYSLTGDTREHALVFGYGPGGNGKSVLVNTASGVIGDYATIAPMDTFVASKGDRHPADVAMLRGARMVTASETEEGRAWAESRIKQLTGSDPVSARFMRQDFFTFKPQFKLMVVGNHKPVLHNVDEAARRRFNIVPFILKPAHPDRELETKLREEWPSILRWMIDGCLDWQRCGLVRPQSIVDATDDYFSAQDVFGQWLDEECDADPYNTHKSETSAKLFESWGSYADKAGEPRGSQKTFAENMQRRGFTRHKSEGVRMFKGVRLLASMKAADTARARAGERE